jgi:glycosyltransferase involved in cell wall biosynthesis
MVNSSSKGSDKGLEAKPQRPRVSVVVIFFDEKRFLQEAVNSVLSQTLEDWELLLVDDGSTDGSSDIAKQAVLKWPQKVHLLEHERHVNRGMSASRNLGLKYAQGEFVLFLDGDDVLTRTTLSEQVTLMEAHPEVGTVYGPIRWWYEWHTDPHERRDFVQPLQVEPGAAIEGPTVVARFLRDEGATPSGNLFRTALVRAVGGFEDDFKGMYEDQVFRVKFFLRFPVYVANRVWYIYRKHANSCCAQAVKRNEAREARGQFLRWTANYCRDHGVRHAQVWKALNAALYPYRHPQLARLKKQVSRCKSRLFWWLVDMAIPLARRVLPKSMRERIWSHVTRTENPAINKGRFIAHEARGHS